MQKRKVRPALSYEDLINDWIARYGEAVKQTDAAKLVGVSRGTIARRVQDGVLRVTPDRRVLTLSLCAYANSFPEPVIAS